MAHGGVVIVCVSVQDLLYLRKCLCQIRKTKLVTLSYFKHKLPPMLQTACFSFIYNAYSTLDLIKITITVA